MLNITSLTRDFPLQLESPPPPNLVMTFQNLVLKKHSYHGELQSYQPSEGSIQLVSIH